MRRGLVERYVSEWLAAMAASHLPDYSAADGSYSLSSETGRTSRCLSRPPISNCRTTRLGTATPESASSREASRALSSARTGATLRGSAAAQSISRHRCVRSGSRRAASST